MLQHGFLRSLQVAMYACVLLLIPVYIGTLFLKVTLGNSQSSSVQNLVGTIPEGLVTHFELAVFRDWPDIAGKLLPEGWGYSAYSCIFAMTIGPAVMGLLIAVSCTNALAIGTGDVEHSTCSESGSRRFKEIMRRALKKGDSGPSEALLSPQEVQDLLRHGEVRHELESLEVPIEAGAEVLFEAIDLHGKGQLPWEEVANGLCSLKGLQRQPEVLLLQRLVVQSLLRSRHRVQAFEDDFCVQSEMENEMLGTRLKHQLSGLHGWAAVR